MLVAKELTAYDALGTHVRDELGINEIAQAKPFQAEWTSGIAFSTGGLLPLFVTLFAPINFMEYLLYAFAILFLVILGILSAKMGGSNIIKAIFRITFWGTAAMGLTALVGYLFGVSLA